MENKKLQQEIKQLKEDKAAILKAFEIYTTYSLNPTTTGLKLAKSFIEKYKPITN
jgi:hypothetical protein